MVSFEEKLSLSEEDKRQETFYQRELEKHFGGKHASCEHGIIDILTNDSIIEIKNWNKYKDSLGQLSSYGIQYPNHKKIVVFFGDVTEAKRIKVVNLFVYHDIEVREARVERDVVIVEELSQVTEKNDFKKWLGEHVVSSNGTIMNLKDVCYSFTGQFLASRVSANYRKLIEQFLKQRFPHVSSLYKDSSLNGVKYRGWIGVRLKQQ